MYIRITIYAILLSCAHSGFAFQSTSYTVVDMLGEVKIKGSTEFISIGKRLKVNDTLEFSPDGILVLLGKYQHILQPKQKELVFKTTGTVDSYKRVLLIVKHLVPVKKIQAAKRGDNFANYVAFLKENTFVALDEQIVFPIPTDSNHEFVIKTASGYKPLEFGDAKAKVSTQNLIQGKPLQIFKKGKGVYTEFVKVFWVHACQNQLLTKLNMLKKGPTVADDDELRAFIADYYGFLDEDVFQEVLGELGK